MASRRRRGSIGLDGAESHYCDLSGRGLTSSQIERTLRVFKTAATVDLSNNEIDKVPPTLPAELVTLDISFNLISSVHGIERLKYVQELHLAFNRLDDVSILEFCPRLLRVNLSGNRLMNTKGLETLEYLEELDLSENLIEFPEALRPLSVNHNLTHLIIRGNPISQKSGYHVPVLDMIPSVIMLDDKKIRSTFKFKVKDVSSTKSLSYARLYDDKKQYVIRKQTRPRPATTVRALLPGEPASKYDGTMFLEPPVEPTHERARAGFELFHQLPDSATVTPPAAPSLLHLSSRTALPATPSSGSYMSLYDRLAQSNGMHVNRSSAPPSKPIINPSRSPRKLAETEGTQQFEGQDGVSRPGRNHIKLPGRSARGTPRRATPVRSMTPRFDNSQDSGHRPAPALSPVVTAGPVTPHAPPVLDDKQRNVLSVIQNLIQHKRQTLATLGGQQVGTPGTPPRARAHNYTGQLVR